MVKSSFIKEQIRVKFRKLISKLTIVVLGQNAIFEPCYDFSKLEKRFQIIL